MKECKKYKCPNCGTVEVIEKMYGAKLCSKCNKVLDSGAG